MTDKDATILHKSKFCNICSAGCSWIECNGQIIEGKITVSDYPAPTESDPMRVINICDNCKNLFKSIAKELLLEEGILKKK